MLELDVGFVNIVFNVRTQTVRVMGMSDRLSRVCVCVFTVFFLSFEKNDSAVMATWHLL